MLLTSLLVCFVLTHADELYEDDEDAYYHSQAKNVSEVIVQLLESGETPKSVADRLVASTDLNVLFPLTEMITNNQLLMDVLKNILHNADGDLHEMLGVNRLLQRYFLQRSNVSRALQQEAQYIVTNLEDSIVGMVLTNMTDFFYTGIPTRFTKETIDLIHFLMQDSALQTRIISEAIDIVYKDVPPQQLVDTIMKLSFLEHCIVALKVLYLKMKRMNHLENPALLSLAENVKKIMNEKNYNKVQTVDKSLIEGSDNLDDLKNILPLSVKNIVFADKVCLVNIKTKMQAGVTLGGETFDRYRRKVSLFEPSSPRAARMWVFQKNTSNSYLIKHVSQREYLLSSVLDYNQDYLRVFSWVNGRSLKSSVFQVELTQHGDEVYLYNKQHSVYLSAGELNKEHVVFAARHGSKDLSGIWRVDFCDF